MTRGLRDYKTGTWIGGDPDCLHATFPGSATGNHSQITSVPENGKTCSLCGATRQDRPPLGGTNQSLRIAKAIDVRVCARYTVYWRCYR